MADFTTLPKAGTYPALVPSKNPSPMNQALSLQTSSDPSLNASLAAQSIPLTAGQGSGVYGFEQAPAFTITTDGNIVLTQPDDTVIPPGVGGPVIDDTARNKLVTESKTPRRIKTPLPDWMQKALMKTEMPFQLDKNPRNSMATGLGGAALGLADVLYNMYGHGQTGAGPLPLDDLSRARALAGLNLIDRDMTPEEEAAAEMADRYKTARISQMLGVPAQELLKMRVAASAAEGEKNRAARRGNIEYTQEQIAKRQAGKTGGSSVSIQDQIVK